MSQLDTATESAGLPASTRSWCRRRRTAAPASPLTAAAGGGLTSRSSLWAEWERRHGLRPHPLVAASRLMGEMQDPGTNTTCLASARPESCSGRPESLSAVVCSQERALLSGLDAALLAAASTRCHGEKRSSVELDSRGVSACHVTMAPWIRHLLHLGAAPGLCLPASRNSVSHCAVIFRMG